MAKLKDKIKEVAKRLFAESGYDAVTLRAIAEEAGTTIGNLTYHYRQKEDIAAAIQQESQADYIAELETIPNEPLEVLRYLCRMTEIAQKGHEENAFYFKNIIELCNKSAVIHKNTMLFREKIYHAYVECFDRLRNSGHMRLDIPVKSYWNLSYTLITLVTIWTQNTSPYYDQHLPHLSLKEAMVSLIFSYLSPSGQALLHEITEISQYNAVSSLKE